MQTIKYLVDGGVGLFLSAGQRGIDIVDPRNGQNRMEGCRMAWG